MMLTSSKCVLLTDISFEEKKLVQSSSNFTLKPELKPTLIACLAGRDAQEVFILDLSKHRAAIQSDCDSCQTDLQCRYSQDCLFPKDMYCLDWISKWFVNWESWSFGKNYALNFLTSVYNSPFIIRVSGWQLFFSLWPLCLMTKKVLCIHTKLISLFVLDCEQ